MTGIPSTTPCWSYGEAFLEADVDGIGQVTALGMDETLFARVGRWKRQLWSTSVVDVARGVLLDVVPGRGGTEPAAWLAAQSEEWRSAIEWATLDLSSPYRAVFDTMLPDATQIADPFHLIKVRHEALCYPVGMKGPHLWPVAAGYKKLGAA